MGVPTGAKFMAYVGHRGEKREKQKREREQRFASISKRRFTLFERQQYVRSQESERLAVL